MHISTGMLIVVTLLAAQVMTALAPAVEEAPAAAIVDYITAASAALAPVALEEAVVQVALEVYTVKAAV